MKIYSKIKNLFKNELSKLLRQSYTRYLKFTNQSDINRWGDKKSLLSSWNERTIIISKEIKPNSIVLEFGAANLYLKELLPENCTYLHSDLVKRNEETIVIDLNKELPVLPFSNYIIFSGVLEYIFDVNLIIKHCSKYTDHLLFSYATADKFPKINNRRYNGWVSDMNEIEFIKLANEINFEIKNIGFWKEQKLYFLTKINK